MLPVAIRKFGSSKISGQSDLFSVLWRQSHEAYADFFTPLVLWSNPCFKPEDFPGWKNICASSLLCPAKFLCKPSRIHRDGDSKTGIKERNLTIYNLYNSLLIHIAQEAGKFTSGHVHQTIIEISLCIKSVCSKPLLPTWRLMLLLRCASWSQSQC